MNANPTMTVLLVCNVKKELVLVSKLQINMVRILVVRLKYSPRERLSLYIIISYYQEQFIPAKFTSGNVPVASIMEPTVL